MGNRIGGGSRADTGTKDGSVDGHGYAKQKTEKKNGHKRDEWMGGGKVIEKKHKGPRKAKRQSSMIVAQKAGGLGEVTFEKKHQLD